MDEPIEKELADKQYSFESDIPEEVRHRKAFKGPLLKKVRNYFREYCSYSSIHGFRYFGEKRTICERIWWFFTFKICLIACVYSIYLVYRKWDKSPVIVSFATRETPTFRIPFPAVTICPQSKSNKTLFNFSGIKKKKTSLTPEEKKYFEYMSLMCQPDKNFPFYSQNDTFSEEFMEVIDKVKPDFGFINCKYMGEEENCYNLFIPILTDEGICYTFNMLDRSELFKDNVYHYKDFFKVKHKSSNWTMEYGYSDETGVATYPKRALLSGAKNALSLNLISHNDYIDYGCKNDSLQGFKVVLHIPSRLPAPSQEYFNVPLNQAVMAAIKPDMITTSESVKMYSPWKRECYFPSERKLKYFKIYTSRNCQMECLANVTLNYCDCVNFFMPRDITSNVSICGSGLFDCMKDAERRLQMKHLYVNLDNNSKTTKKKQKILSRVRDCDCLPICNDLTYNAETSQTDYDWIKQCETFGCDISKFLDPVTNKSMYHMSQLTIFFKTNRFITSQRNELYGPTDFLANFGGLLGLFTGFSVLSLMELIYFLTVRLCCNIRLYGNWAGAETK